MCVCVLDLVWFPRHLSLLRDGEVAGEAVSVAMKSPAKQNCPSEQLQENSPCCFAVFLPVTLVRSWPAPPSAIWEILEDSVQSPALCDQSWVESKNMSCYRTPIVAVSPVLLELITKPSKKKFLALHWSGSCWGDRAVPRLVCGGGGLAGSGTGAVYCRSGRSGCPWICPGCKDTFLLWPTLKTQENNPHHWKALSAYCLVKPLSKMLLCCTQR